MGASLVVISPELPERTADMAGKHGLSFPILWDEQSRVAEAYGLAFTLPEDLKAVYMGFGNDLAQRNGDPSWRLPIPSRFIIDRTAVVRLVQADPDYRYRPEPETTLVVLREVAAE